MIKIGDGINRCERSEIMKLIENGLDSFYKALSKLFDLDDVAVEQL